jgi:hypothetical protein
MTAVDVGGGYVQNKVRGGKFFKLAGTFFPQVFKLAATGGATHSDGKRPHHRPITTQH